MTVKQAIERLLAVIEPLSVRKKADGTAEYITPPRFQFGYKHDEDTPDGKAERALFNQTCPEMTFTRQTLREQLQQIGQFIHAEPRLIWRTIDGKRQMVWIFDRYGGQETAKYTRTDDGKDYDLKTYPYKAKRFSYHSDVACTHIESDTDNFVNRLDGIGGTVTEPFGGGALTLRSDAVYTRFEDSENLYFPTTRPIMDITRFEWVDLEGFAGVQNAAYDITQFIYEKTIYDAQLSSYSAQYPRSKCYGLYFTQGEKNIRGFFFKNEEWSDGVFANYAIVNILSRASGKDLKNILKKVDTVNHTGRYPFLAFRLTYTPVYGARIAHGKTYTGDMLKKPFTLAYNQSSNVVETRYYGEHLKGVAERLGNAEEQVDILMRKVKNVPKIGQLWDDDYYISRVKGSVVSDCMIFNVVLSKRYNRLSEYVGANSYIRYYEVSERMSQERRTLYKDYLVITQKEHKDISIIPDDCGVWRRGLLAVANTFYQSDGVINQLGSFAGNVCLEKDIVSFVKATGYSKNFSPLTSVYLSATSSALGNCMEFTWSFKDNYSAGVSSVKGNGVKDKKDISGYFGAEVTYSDYYGRAYFQQWSLGTEAYSVADKINLERALALPGVEAGWDGMYTMLGIEEGGFNYYHVLQKDNREKLYQCYSIEYVTDIKGLIIGSALSRNNPMIGGRVKDKDGNDCYAELYVLQNRVNRFSNDKLDLSEENARLALSFTEEDFTNPSNTKIKLVYDYFEGTKGKLYLRFEGAEAPASGKAWAIVTRKYQGDPKTYEDEDGNVVTITPEYGGEVLIAWNGDIKVGGMIGQFNIVPTHDIFKFKEAEKQ